ncbi:dihydrodipicolinate synthase family protein [Neoroseomonas oryzicola]|uniref:Dihydrodipicolinate synthase family protein n=1 Tax=Neoroseomonas oryzicola TaxID=535904 RepID=A0A9X9WFH4_9PROT|nr:dihydrodipicolinate synthase family protein [Neoroseomonas oryzicola]MBR0659084.1 dihydrodipicolinate synthase family protein [Neoroseomonas oryzicola]NKE17021.1 dihydrodipicolinate synthase family protein [Neoroseomonas oryzicola]
MTALHPTGVFSAALTPFDADLAPDHAAFVAHAKRLLDQGCDGIAMLGTTGEANSLTTAERQALLEATVAGGVAPDRLLPGTGVAALPDTIALTRHALSCGVTTVVMLPPFYYKGISDDGLFAAYAEVIERVADPRLRVVLYHIPPMSAVPITFPVIERLRARYPGTFTGIKDSSGDLANMKALVKTFPGLSVLAGADPLMLPLLKEGGAGCITATSNLVAADLAFIFRHHADPARAAEVEAAQARVVAARNQVSRFPQIASLKAMLAERTGQPGWRRLRPPLLALTNDEAAAMLAA